MEKRDYYEIKEEIADVVNNLDDSTLFQVWNDFCEAERWDENRIYQMEELDDLCYGLTATEILDKCGEINTCDYYFYETIYGLESCDCVNECEGFDADAVANYCLDCDEDFGCEEIRELLDEYNAEEEEEEEEEEE